MSGARIIGLERSAGGLSYLPVLLLHLALCPLVGLSAPVAAWSGLLSLRFAGPSIRAAVCSRRVMA